VAIPKAVASYYKGVPASHKATLLEMRRRILEVVPDAQEVIKYSMPTFVVDGHDVAGLLCNKNHIGYYPYSGSILNQFPEIQAKYSTTKAAIHVPIDTPMLKGEVKKLIKARMKLNS
jgi:uncharacterized protein YdhG (YjbR/CyaY superfamily)